MAKKRFATESENYDFNKQTDPTSNMGAKSFANMPENPMILPYGESENYRRGILNDNTCGIRKVSKLEENRKNEKGPDNGHA